MKTIRRSFLSRSLPVHLVAVLLVFSIFTVPAEAMFVPSAPHQEAQNAPAGSAERTADLAKIQKTLESKIIQQKLMDFGLSSEEAMARINKLSDSQISLLASHVDALQAGGMRDNTLILVLLLILLIVILI